MFHLCGPPTNLDIELLERVQHFALKISLKQWTGHYSERLVAAELPPLTFRRNCARVTVLYEILNKLIDYPRVIMKKGQLHTNSET